MLKLNLPCPSQPQTIPITINPQKPHLVHSISSKHSLTLTHLTLPTPSLSLSSKPTSVSCRQSEYYPSTTASSPRPQFPPNDGSFSSGAKVFVGYSIYKGKAALTVEPRPPEFAPLDSGAFKIGKEGFVLLQFAPAAGVRQYDWSRKQVFSLSVMEIGSLVSLGTRESCEFFHDPNKGKSDEGKVRKVLKVEPLPDGSGHFFNLSVQNKLLNIEESIYIPVTKAEFAVLVATFNYILPYLLGWHCFANSIKPDENSRVNNANPRYADYEWSR